MLLIQLALSTQHWAFYLSTNEVCYFYTEKRVRHQVWVMYPVSTLAIPFTCSRNLFRSFAIFFRCPSVENVMNIAEFYQALDFGSQMYQQYVCRYEKHVLGEWMYKWAYIHIVFFPVCSLLSLVIKRIYFALQWRWRVNILFAGKKAKKNTRQE